MAASPEEVDDELVVLQAIYGERLDTSAAPTAVRLPLEARATEDVYGPPVTIDVVLAPTHAYPAAPPTIQITAVHGLDGSAVAALAAALRARSSDAAGIAHLYDLFELAQERLDELAVPAGPCPVCLLELAPSPAAPVQCTPCYHRFHAACLLGAIRYQQERAAERRAVHQARSIAAQQAPEDLATLVCPLCRISLGAFDVTALENLAHASAEATGSAPHDVVEIPAAVRAEVARLQAVLERQRQAGGIIDVEENQRRLRVDATTFVQPLPPPPLTVPLPAVAAETAAASHARKAGSHATSRSGRGNHRGANIARPAPTQRAPRRPQAPPED